MTTIAELLAAVPDEPRKPTHPWMDYSHYYADQLARRDALLRVAYEALKEAREDIESWAGYASEYFQNKHDLAGTLTQYDAVLAAINPLAAGTAREAGNG